MIRSRLRYGAGLLVVAFFVSCVDGESPSVPVTSTASVAVVPVFQAIVGDGAPAPGEISRIRVTARLASDDSVLETFLREVDPSATEWTLSLEIPVPDGGGATLLTIELISVTDGAETVEWSGRSAPIQLTAGPSTQPVTVPVVRGPPENIGVTAISVTPDSARIPEGGTVQLETIVSTDGTAGTRAFWTALDPTVGVDDNGLVTGIAPGLGRVAVGAGAHADTARIFVDATANAVVVTPDSVLVDGLGASAGFSASVVDARGAPVAGYDVQWRSLDPLVAASLGGGEFTSRSAGRARVVVRVVQDSTLADTALVVVSPPPFDVMVRKTTPSEQVVRGDTILFVIEAANLGEGPAGEVVVRDPLPEGLDFVDVTTTAGDYRPADGAWSVGLLSSGATQRLTIRAVVTAAAGSRILNVARLVGVAADADPLPDNNEASAAVEVLARRADLAIAKTVDRGRVTPGDTVVFRVGLRNLGPHTARSVRVRDLLPARLDLLEAAATGGRLSADSLIWRFDSIRAGDEFILEVITRAGDFRPDEAGTVNVARIESSGTTDPNAANQRAEAEVVIDRVRADIALSKTADRSQASVGDTVGFRVVVVNRGPGRATEVRVQEAIDSTAFMVVSGRVTEGQVDTARALWSIGVMVPGQADTLELLATVEAGASGRTVFNRAYSLGLRDEVDPDASNDTATVAVSAGANTTDLRVLKTADRSTAFERDTVKFVVLVQNAGPAPVDSLVVQDSLFAGLSYLSHSLRRGTFDPQTGRWNLGAMAVGRLDTLELLATVQSGRAGSTVHNTAFLRSWTGASDSDTQDNGQTASVSIQGVDLSVVKSAADTVVSEGDTVRFTVRLTNHSSRTVTNVVVRDTVPQGLVFVKDSLSSGIFTSGTGQWSVPSVASGATEELRTVYVVSSGQGGRQIRNEARREAGDQTDTQPSNDVSTAEVRVRPANADVQISKSAGSSTAFETDTLDFTIVAKNVGPASVDSLVVRDSLSAGLSYVSHQGPGSFDAGTGRWTVGSLAAGKADTIRLRYRVHIGQANKTVSNSALAVGRSSGTVDPDSSNDQASTSVSIQGIDLAMHKEASHSFAAVGDTVRFVVRAENKSNKRLTNVVIRDTIPAALMFVDSIVGNGSYDRSTGLWTMPSMAPLASDSLVVRVVVPSAPPGTRFRNEAQRVSTDQTDTNPENDVATVEVEVYSNVNTLSPSSGPLPQEDRSVSLPRVDHFPRPITTWSRTGIPRARPADAN